MIESLGIAAVIVAVVALFSGWVRYLHSDLKENLGDCETRQRYAARLRRPALARDYRRWLLRALLWARWLMGSGYATRLGYRVCVTLSFVYAAAIFLLAWAAGGPSAIGETTVLPDDPLKWPWLSEGPLPSVSSRILARPTWPHDGSKREAIELRPSASVSYTWRSAAASRGVRRFGHSELFSDWSPGWLHGYCFGP